VLAIALAAAPASAQTPNAPPRPVGEIGPTPTNPTDTGFGTTTGVGSAAPPVPTVTPTPRAPLPTGPVVVQPPPATTLPPGAVRVPPTRPVGPVPPQVVAEIQLPPAFVPQPGGMTAEQAATRALRTSYAVEAARAGIAVAQAQQAEAGRAMIPQVSLQARYTRLSEYQPGSIPFFNAAGCLQNFAQCQMDPNQFFQNVVLQQAILDQYAFRASVTIPLSDIPLRLLQFYRAAGLTAEARQIELEMARSLVGLQAREAFYEYLRARASLAATEQALETARARREDVARFVEAGSLARAELLRADASVADLERTAVQARNGTALNESLLRQRTHMRNDEPLTVGEALEEPVTMPANVQDLVQRAWTNRPEAQSIERQVRALDANIAATRAQYFPSLAATGNFDYANPNPRIFPQTTEFRATWDASLAVTWSPTQAFGAEATVSRLQAQRAQVMAQLGQQREGIETEVRSYWAQARVAEAQVDSARAALVSAQEAYRVTVERFQAGAAVATELANAQTDLLRAHLGVINAYVDLRLAVARVRRASGEREASR
jgi:outer membrane protein TolC